MKKLDLAGKRFGKLVAIRESEKTYLNGQSYWWCKCDCGNEKEIAHRHLLHNKTKSCGCLLHERRHDFGESALKSCLERYKAGAKERNLNFSLTDNEFKYLIKQPCFYCGTPPNQKTQLKRGHGYLIHGGIDRIDSSIGYISTNCIPCCGTCNRAKLKMSFEEYLDWMHKIYLRVAMNFNTKEELEGMK